MTIQSERWTGRDEVKEKPSNRFTLPRNVNNFKLGAILVFLLIILPFIVLTNF